MSRLTRKFVAVLMLLWLPLSGAGALAATVSMQAQGGACHEASMPDMHHADAGEHQHHHADAPAAQDQTASNEEGSSCTACGVCHFACNGYLVVPAAASLQSQSAALLPTPYQVSFSSITSAPLLPPPLARA